MRPLIAVPARFSASASALRFQAEVAARKLITAVYDGGAEPLTVHPDATTATDGSAIADRFGFVDAVLMPGGGDIDPARYGAPSHPSVYDVDIDQDSFDLALVRWALATGRPVLAICRGLQIVNVARGGTLVTDMPNPHRHRVLDLDLQAGSQLRAAAGTANLAISCYHHQSLGSIGDGLHATAWADDHTVEAVELDDAQGQWFVGVQWHPEDTADRDPAQAAIFRAFTAAALDFGDGAR